MKRPRSPSLIVADLRDGIGDPTLLNIELEEANRPQPPELTELQAAQLDAPVAANVERGPAALFPEEERSKYKHRKWGKKMRAILVSGVEEDGALRGGCSACVSKSCVAMTEFAPVVCNVNGHKRPRFFEAVHDFKTAYETGDLEAAREARGRVEKYRTALCPSCAENAGKLSRKEQACKDEYIYMRKAACALNNGCCNPWCVERGAQAWCVLEGDHLHTAKEGDETLRKKHALSHYTWWAGNGGVEAMRAEVDKGVNWPCRFCHTLEKTSNQANKYEDLETMPEGKSYGTKEEVKQYGRKRKAKIVYPKQQHVDAHKREIGCCELCKRPVVEGQEHAFDFDHIDASTKMKGKDTLAGERGGVCGLVRNHASRAALDKIKNILDNEMSLCRLLCRNCHHRHTWGYPMRV
jgi:hypothetical protein